MKILRSLGLIVFLVAGQGFNFVAASSALPTLETVTTSDSKNFLEQRDALAAKIRSKIETLAKQVAANESPLKIAHEKKLTRYVSLLDELLKIDSVDDLRERYREHGGVLLPDVSASKLIDEMGKLNSMVDELLMTYHRLTPADADTSSVSTGGSSSEVSAVDLRANIENIITRVSGLSAASKGTEWGAALKAIASDLAAVKDSEEAKEQVGFGLQRVTLPKRFKIASADQRVFDMLTSILGRKE